MGGNVFKTTHEPVRLTTEELVVFSDEWCSILKEHSVEHVVPRNVGEKLDHGDLDVLVLSENLETFINNFIVVNNIPMVRNGSVISLLYKSFQVDLIKTPKEDLEFSTFYFSFNDLGNLLGRMSKNLGLKLKHDGLYYVLRSEDHVLKEFLLSKNYKQFLNILEVDVDKYKKGFNTYTEMFEYVSSSPYFDSGIFKLENLNNKNRVRDRKRKTYNMFLDWCELQSFTDQDKLTSEEKEEFVISHFPVLKEGIDFENHKYLVQLSVKRKFNGNLIISLIPELEGKELGDFISAYKQSIEGFDSFIINSNEDDLNISILEFHKRFKNATNTCS